MEEMIFLNQALDLRLRDAEAWATRVSLMSVTATTIRFGYLRAAVGAAAAESDMVGALSDGSIGVLAIRERAAEGGMVVEERFLARLKTALLASARLRADGRIGGRFRSVHRWISELGGAEQLIGALSVAPARALTIASAQQATIQMGWRATQR